MTDDPNRRTLRQFQCRDYLWETFEQMSQELECSVDYLINEAMRHYARGQGRLRQTAPPAARATVGGGAVAPGQPPQMPQGQNPRPMPPMNPNQMTPTNGAPRPPQMPPPMSNGGMPSAPMQSFQQQPPRMPQQPPQMAPQQPPQQYGQQPQYNPPQRPQPPQAPPQPPPMAQQPPQMAASGLLYALFEGQKYPINKDEFFIGRSNKSCDLIVKDPNVSRQHARIVRHQGQYWMVDMGSTNGIEFQGGRVDRRVIAEGDSFRICDHEILFTYH